MAAVDHLAQEDQVVQVAVQHIMAILLQAEQVIHSLVVLHLLLLQMVGEVMDNLIILDLVLLLVVVALKQMDHKTQPMVVPVVMECNYHQIFAIQNQQ